MMCRPILLFFCCHRNLLNSPDNFLECLLDARCEDYIRANTLLLLLVVNILLLKIYGLALTLEPLIVFLETMETKVFF